VAKKEKDKTPVFEIIFGIGGCH